MSSAPLFGFAGSTSTRRKSSWVVAGACRAGTLRSPATRETGSRGRSAVCAARRPAHTTRGSEVAARRGAVDPLRHRAHDLKLESPAGSGVSTGGSVSPATSCQRKPEVLGHVGDRRASIARRRRAIRATHAAGARCCRSGRPIPRSGRSRRRTRCGRRPRSSSRDGSAAAAPGVKLASDLGTRDQAVAHRTHLAARRSEQGERRARPHEHADREPLRELCQEVPENHPLVAAHELEVGREVPARQVDVGAARSNTAAISGSAWAPSIRISARLPGRGGGSPAAQPPAGGSTARSHPILRRRRTWCRVSPREISSPIQRSAKRARSRGRALKPDRTGCRARTRGSR